MGHALLTTEDLDAHTRCLDTAIIASLARENERWKHYSKAEMAPAYDPEDDLEYDLAQARSERDAAQRYAQKVAGENYSLREAWEDAKLAYKSPNPAFSDSCNAGDHDACGFAAICECRCGHGDEPDVADPSYQNWYDAHLLDQLAESSAPQGTEAGVAGQPETTVAGGSA
jgi:hypothetical protein